MILKRCFGFAVVGLMAVSPACALDYNVPSLQANIAPTKATEPDPKVPVEGQPRMAKGHPCTLWDKQDVELYKKLVETNPEAKAAYGKLRDRCFGRMKRQLEVPVPRQGPDGQWVWPGDFPESESPFGHLSRTNEANVNDAAALGAMYQLSGNERYAEYAKQILLAYADAYPKYGHPPGWTKNRYRSAQDMRLTHQFLDDGFYLMAAGFAYDLIYELPGWTPEERKKVHDDLLQAVAAEFVDPVLGKPDQISSLHNRAAICAAATLIAGYATEDAEMINNATYGVGGTKEKPVGGLMGTHYTRQCILPDGMWLEGAPGYQVGIASAALFNGAEVLWRHGIDAYRFDGGVLKQFLDSTLALAYPDEKITVAALHDSGRLSLLSDAAWFTQESGLAYQCGYQRYRDPRYIPIIKNSSKAFTMTTHSGGPSLFLDLPDETGTRVVQHANFYATGFGVQRLETEKGPNQLIFEFGSSMAGHSHPSKLAIDLYALKDTIIPFPGVIFPYNHPMDPKWYWTTPANCTLVVDEKAQIYAADYFKYPRGTPKPYAQQLVYAPAATMALQRGNSDTTYTGVMQDRSLFLTPRYLADVFAAFSDSSHRYDMAWHLRGQFSSVLPLTEMQFPEPVAPGYNGLTEVRHAASTAKPWDATVKLAGGQPVRLVAAGGTPTEVIVGKGHFYTKTWKDDEEPPTILQRRDQQKNAIYGNVVDISGDATGYVSSLTQEGSAELGYALLKVGTTKGTDLCFTAFRPGSFRLGGLETNGMQAFVAHDGAAVQAMYLAGGSMLKTDGGLIGRDQPGLAFVEKTKEGGYVVGNPSPTDAVVMVALTPLMKLKAFEVNEKGERGGPARVGNAGGVMSLQIKARCKVEFIP